VRVVRTQAEMRAAVSGQRAAGLTVGLVPTLGALHDGHRSLVRAARSRCDTVAVSIFVNPLQFGAGEDLAAYPRTEDRDLELASAEGTDLVFAPLPEEMAMEATTTRIAAGPVAEVLEGASRPGHFPGVCIVVAKLLNIVTPDFLFLGQKDAQQNAVLRRLVSDLSFGVEVVVCPTVREPEGLALSSRNAYLSAPERRRATVLFRALRAGEAVLEQGGDVPAAEGAMWEVLRAEPDVAPDYARAVDPDSFEAAGSEGPVLLAIAARVGPVRLIDNLLIRRRGAECFSQST
jgi:pantoate--beta-alanine ligase